MSGAGPDSHTENAEWILWQEYQQGYLTSDQLAQTIELLEPERQHAAFDHLLGAGSGTQPAEPDAVAEAQVAIWQLFEAGLIDHDSATVAMLAIHVGVQRSSRRRRGGRRMGHF